MPTDLQGKRKANRMQMQCKPKGNATQTSFAFNRIGTGTFIDCYCVCICIRILVNIAVVKWVSISLLLCVQLVAYDICVKLNKVIKLSRYSKCQNKVLVPFKYVHAWASDLRNWILKPKGGVCQNLFDRRIRYLNPWGGMYSGSNLTSTTFLSLGVLYLGYNWKFYF